MALTIKGLNTGVIRHNDKFIALALKVKSLRNKETLLFFSCARAARLVDRP